MLRRGLCICFALLVMLIPLTAAGEGHVYAVSETTPFSEDATVLTVWAAPLHKADCTLITLGELSILVDSGTPQDVPAVRAMLRAAGVDHIDIFFNSHPHIDHLGGFIILAEEGFPFGEFITVFPEEESGIASQQISAMRTAKERNIPVVTMKSGDSIPFGDAELTVYRVPDDRITNRMSTNDLSAMLMVRYGDCSILLTGDVELPAQAVLAETCHLKADILKYPHHGLAVMNDDFLREINPGYVFITCNSIRSLFGQKMLRDNGYHRVSFTTWGMISMRTDGTKWIVSQDVDPDLSWYCSWFLNVNQWIQPIS